MNEKRKKLRVFTESTQYRHIYTVWICQNRLSVGIQLPSSVKQNETFCCKYTPQFTRINRKVCVFEKANSTKWTNILERSCFFFSLFVYSEKPVKHTRQERKKEKKNINFSNQLKPKYQLKRHPLDKSTGSLI